MGLGDNTLHNSGESVGEDLRNDLLNAVEQANRPEAAGRLCTLFLWDKGDVGVVDRSSVDASVVKVAKDREDIVLDDSPELLIKPETEPIWSGSLVAPELEGGPLNLLLAEGGC